MPFTTTFGLFTTTRLPLDNIPGKHLLLGPILVMKLKPQIMPYKVKSLIYLICFIASVLIYSQVDTSSEELKTEDIQLVQTQTEDLQQQKDEAL